MSLHAEDRRSALARIVSGALGFITAGVAGLVGLVASPGTSTPSRQWRRAVSIFDLPPSQPMAAVLVDRTDDGWYATSKQQVVFIDREGEGYRALSATCQHLGCRVHFDVAKQQYLCPCHGGVYDRQGRVLAGPPPRPLQTLKVRVNESTSDIEVEL
jgi:Rieske Fe-S protein